MFKRTILILVLCYFITEKNFAQSFMHGIGANVSVINAKINTQNDKYTFTMMVTHFSYFPRLNISESENRSFSVGFPLGAGIGILNNGQGNGSGIAWGVDLPVAADYNLGCGSTPENEDRFGGYFGAGFGYLYTGWSDGSGSSKAITYGPLARAGIRFSSSRASWRVTVGIFYKIGLESEKYKTFGFNVISEL
jgi:hypothetical protein